MAIKNKYIYTIAILCLGIIAGLAIPQLSLAADVGSGLQIIPDECLGAQLPGDKPCDLNSFVQLFVNLAQVALKILPFLAMLMMMWAGFNLITAGGNPEKIQQGKKMAVSVLVGVIIVLFLAWSYASFVVFALTGSVNVFPGTPFSKEWWGGGTATGHPANSGCCVVPNTGCTETTQAECSGMSALFDGVQFMGENNFCSEYKAVCENFTKGCCVPYVPEGENPDKICYWPDPKKGCIDYPTTVHKKTACTYLGQDCDPAKIQGTGSADETVTGCCSNESSCTTTTIAECPQGSTFSQGVDCSDVEQCKGGCCIGKNGCTDGKTDCSANLYNTESCSALQNTLCRTGCCVQPGNTNCYNNTTQGYCTTVLGSNNHSALTSCSMIGQCTNGCCQNTCQAGNIDGACAGPDMIYDAVNTCAANVSCAPVCCLYQNALTCSSSVSRGSCSPPNNQVILGGPGGTCPTMAGGLCATGTCWDSATGACASPVADITCNMPDGFIPDGAPLPPQCTTGCCNNPNGDLSCHDNYPQGQCTSQGGTPTAGSCSNVADCSGCCNELTGKYNCFNSYTRSKCDNIVGQYRAQTQCSTVEVGGQRICTLGCCTAVAGGQKICYLSATARFCTVIGGTFSANDVSCTNSMPCDSIQRNNI